MRSSRSMSYQADEAEAVPDYAAEAGDFFDGTLEEAAPTLLGGDTIEAQRLQIEQFRRMAAAHRSVHGNAAAAHSMPGARASTSVESDALLPPLPRASPSSSSSSSSLRNQQSQTQLLPLSPYALAQRQSGGGNGSFVLPASYPSPLGETQFRPFPIATGSDRFGPFEVFQPSIHPAGRHYHAFKESGTTVYGPCPPCLTMDMAHTSTESFTALAWLVGVCCFPCGLLCCCFGPHMVEKSCSRCGSKLEE